MSKILLLGAQGQLGRCLALTAPKGVELVLLDRTLLDVTDPDRVQAVISQHAPEFVINCTAFTNVDGAEENEAIAYAVNRDGVRNIAIAARTVGAKVIHVSTDFVFDGGENKPYRPDSPCNPLGVYGKSKWAGEQALLDGYPEGAAVIRTSWLYSECGGNFVKTMLKLHESKENFQVVNDQFGSPTYALGLADLIWQVVQAQSFAPGVYHWCDKGITSWFEFAKEIGRLGEEVGLISKQAEVQPIAARDYGATAPRPQYSALDCELTLSTFTALKRRQWQDQLCIMLQKLVSST